MNEDVEHSRVNAWINTAIRRNVVEIDLWAMYSGSSQILELPKSLFMCKTLESLKLRSPFISNLPASGCFPSLKFLYVDFFREVHDTMLPVFSNLPKLEDLTIRCHSRCDSSQKLNIAAPALKKLRLSLYTNDNGINSYNYLINCPKLENLYVNERVPSTYYWGKAKSLVRASIYLHQHCSNEQLSFYDVTALLAGVSNVIDLCLSAHCFEVGCQVVSEDSESEEGSDHEERSESEQGSYDVDGPVNEQGSEHEVNSKSEEGSLHKGGLDHEDGLDSVQGSEHQWNPLDSVPRCCWLHLKIVSMENFRGNREELEVAKYLLQYGHVLNKITISLDDLDWVEKVKIYEEIQWLPRASRTCRVVLTSKGGFV
ncbi:PREDICTED: F-box/FBD/LRR-repeat protein At3g52680-like [Fragaria vesca subsp. vesca]